MATDQYGRILCVECTNAMKRISQYPSRRGEDNVIVFKCDSPECGHVAIFDLPATREGTAINMAHQATR